jgi:hypothetical protein
MRLTFRSLSLILAPILVLGGLVFDRASATNKQASAMLIADSGKTAQTAPPMAGITLLEGIYKKLRDEPKLAMAKQPMQIAQVIPEDGARDSFLRIRPAAKNESSAANQIAYAPTLNDFKGSPVAASAMSMRGTMRSATAASGTAGNAAAGGATLGGSSGKWDATVDKAKKKETREAKEASDASTTIADNRPVLQQFQAAHRLPPQTEARMRKSLGGLAKAYGDIDALTSADQAAAPQNVRNYAANAAPSAPARIRIDQISGHKTIADEPQIIEYNPAQRQFRGQNLQAAQNQLSAMTSAARQQAAPQQAAPQPASISQAPGFTNGAFAPQGMPAGGLVPPPPPSSTPVAQAPSAPADELKPPQPALFKNIWNMTRGLQSQQINDNEGSGSLRRDIAMLSPRVVGGIPSVRLGVSAHQIQHALGNSVVIKKQNIGSWNVWSVSRQNSKDAILQIYLRSGVVEAIRVFDPVYLGSEIGVKLGDDLRTMLRQFSQPAFIIEEPAISHQSGKNYVYPISHISFELARAKDGTHTDPQVVSALIFDVE